MIDTHSHIFSEEFKEDLPEVIARAKEIGVEKIFMPKVSLCSTALLCPKSASRC